MEWCIYLCPGREECNKRNSFDLLEYLHEIGFDEFLEEYYVLLRNRVLKGG